MAVILMLCQNISKIAKKYNDSFQQLNLNSLKSNVINPELFSSLSLVSYFKLKKV